MFGSIISVWNTVIVFLGCVMLVFLLQFFIRLSFRKKKSSIRQHNFIQKIFFYHIKEQIPISLFIVNFIYIISMFLLTIIGIINIFLQNVLTSSILSAVGILFFVTMFIESIIVINNKRF